MVYVFCFVLISQGFESSLVALALMIIGMFSVLYGSIIKEVREYKRSLSKRLYFRAFLYNAAVFCIGGLSLVILGLAFMFLNLRNIPPLISVAGNCFLITFILLNLIHWLGESMKVKGMGRSSTHFPAPPPR